MLQCLLDSIFKRHIVCVAAYKFFQPKNSLKRIQSEGDFKRVDSLDSDYSGHKTPFVAKRSSFFNFKEQVFGFFSAFICTKVVIFVFHFVGSGTNRIFGAGIFKLRLFLPSGRTVAESYKASAKTFITKSIGMN